MGWIKKLLIIQVFAIKTSERSLSHSLDVFGNCGITETLEKSDKLPLKGNPTTLTH